MIVPGGTNAPKKYNALPAYMGDLKDNYGR
jgi:hypothetical protein